MATTAGEHLWSIEQIVALAQTSARFGAGEALAVPARWSHTGASERVLWGRYHGSAAEPYEVAVDHVRVRARCTCPSRVHPCKHVIGVLIMWVRGHVADVTEPAAIGSWADRDERKPATEPDAPTGSVDTGAGRSEGSDRAAGGPAAGVDDTPGPAEPQPAEPRPGADADRSRNERVERLRGGLVELDRWLEDRLRVGLSDPSVARFATWDELAARLVDARAGSLANRVRRLAGRVGASPDWHEQVLAEMGILHLIAQAGQRVPSLPRDLADAVAVTCGWQVRKSDVEASAPETDRWFVAGRSDTREDLVEVRRVWLRGLDSGTWAMVLSFAAYRQSLDTTLEVGTILHADVHRYPGSSHRVLVGEVHGAAGASTATERTATSFATTVAGACAEIGAALAAEPWLDRVPVTLVAGPTLGADGWVLSDDTGSLVVAPDAVDRGDSLAIVLAASCGVPVTMTVEWTTTGVVPLAVFLDDRTLDVGPRADPTFVSAA
jgi:hypothetical protein